MASILDFLSSEKGKKFINKASGEVGEDPDKVKSVLATALPMMLGAMKKKSESPDGAAKLNQALEDQKHDGSILEKISGGLGGGNLPNLLDEGSGILKHVFGTKQGKIEEAISASSGMEISKISHLLKMAAPVIMGILGNQKRKDKVGQGGIKDLLGSVMGSNSKHDQSMLESFLGNEGKGNFKDDIGKILGGKSNSKGLGDFF